MFHKRCAIYEIVQIIGKAEAYIAHPPDRDNFSSRPTTSAIDYFTRTGEIMGIKQLK